MGKGVCRESNGMRSGSKKSESPCGVSQRVGSVAFAALSVNTGSLSRMCVSERQPALCMFGMGTYIHTEDRKRVDSGRCVAGS